jgi:hypothetical protein
LTQAALLLGQGFLEQDEACPYWPLRSTVEEATVRATPLGDADMFATADSLATLELEFSGIGLCTLWPDKVSIEPGKKSKHYKLMTHCICVWRHLMVRGSIQSAW